MNLLVNVPNQAAYQISLKNPYEATNEKLALALETKTANYRQDTTQLFSLNSNEQVKVLSAVVVQAKPPAEHFRSVGPNMIGRNECGDFVCVNEVLNCPVHKDDMGNKPPVVGMAYYLYLTGPVGKVQYEGCTTEEKQKSYAFRLVGIYASQEIYATDEAQLASQEPAYYSTLYWNPAISIEENKDLSLSFYTSDVEGMFKVIVQGRTSDDVVYGEASFTVKNND